MIKLQKKNLEFDLDLKSDNHAFLLWYCGHYTKEDTDQWLWNNLEEEIKDIIKEYLTGDWRIINKWENHGRNGIELKKEM